MPGSVESRQSSNNSPENQNGWDILMEEADDSPQTTWEDVAKLEYGSEDREELSSRPQMKNFVKRVLAEHAYRKVDKLINGNHRGFNHSYYGDRRKAIEIVENGKADLSDPRVAELYIQTKFQTREQKLDDRNNLGYAKPKSLSEKIEDMKEAGIPVEKSVGFLADDFITQVNGALNDEAGNNFAAEAGYNSSRLARADDKGDFNSMREVFDQYDIPEIKQKIKESVDIQSFGDKVIEQTLANARDFEYDTEKAENSRENFQKNIHLLEELGFTPFQESIEPLTSGYNQASRQQLANKLGLIDGKIVDRMYQYKFDALSDFTANQNKYSMSQPNIQIIDELKCSGEDDFAKFWEDLSIKHGKDMMTELAGLSNGKTIVSILEIPARDYAEHKDDKDEIFDFLISHADRLHGPDRGFAIAMGEMISREKEKERVEIENDKDEPFSFGPNIIIQEHNANIRKSITNALNIASNDSRLQGYHFFFDENGISRQAKEAALLDRAVGETITRLEPDWRNNFPGIPDKESYLRPEDILENEELISSLSKERQSLIKIGVEHDWYDFEKLNTMDLSKYFDEDGNPKSQLAEDMFKSRISTRLGRKKLGEIPELASMMPKPYQHYLDILTRSGSDKMESFPEPTIKSLFTEDGAKPEFWQKQFYGGEIGSIIRYAESFKEDDDEDFVPDYTNLGLSGSQQSALRVSDKIHSSGYVDTLTDFVKNDELEKYFDDEGPTAEFWQRTFYVGDFSCLMDQEVVPNDELGLSEKQAKSLEVYGGIDDYSMQDEFRKFVIEKDSEGNPLLEKIPESRLESAPIVLGRISTSNASEMVVHGSAIAHQILRTNLDDDEKMFSALSEIEDVFIRNYLPMSGKTFSVFSILHKLDSIDEDFQIKPENEKISPALKEAAEKGETADVIYRDLIKSYLGSSIATARGFNSLLSHFNMDTGFESSEAALEYSKRKITEAHQRNIEASRHDLKLEAGDLVKGVGGIGYLSAILENGSNAREFLGDGADSDRTPLDTDLSRVFEDADSFDDGINDLECKNYGPIYFVLKGKRNGEERFQTTRRSPLEEGVETDSVDLDSNKLEAFYTGAIGKHHYGIRTGFASSEIDGIVVNDNDHLSNEVGLEVALNGFYIPVYDTSGKCIFTPEDYDEMRHKMSGLEHYEGVTSIDRGAEFSENYSYEFAPDLSIPGVNVDELAASVSEARAETEERHKAIDAVFAKAFEELGLRRKDYIDGNLEPGSIEVADTGSTGRGTNVPHDGDYDYMFRIDRADLIDSVRTDTIREAFLSALGKEKVSEDEVAQDNIIRLKHVNIPGINEEIQVDITMEQKTNRIRYSTDESLRRRIAAMRIEDPEKTDQAIANIIFAKKFCKAVGAYKPHRSPDIPEDKKGGLGGVGVENWILQNGGSFVESAKNFVAAARNQDDTIKSYEDFCADYQIFDFGENHMSKPGEDKHDNFVSRNMSKGGYNRLVKALKDFVDNGVFPESMGISAPEPEETDEFV